MRKKKRLKLTNDYILLYFLFSMTISTLVTNSRDWAILSQDIKMLHLHNLEMTLMSSYYQEESVSSNLLGTNTYLIKREQWPRTLQAVASQFQFTHCMHCRRKKMTTTTHQKLIISEERNGMRSKILGTCKQIGFSIT